MVTISNCDKDDVTCKAQNLYYLTLSKKCLVTLLYFPGPGQSIPWLSLDQAASYPSVTRRACTFTWHFSGLARPTLEVAHHHPSSTVRWEDTCDTCHLQLLPHPIPGMLSFTQGDTGFANS
jgi:hypothetical protein